MARIVLGKQVGEPSTVEEAAHQFIIKLNTHLSDIHESHIASPFKTPGPSPKKQRKKEEGGQEWHQFDAMGNIVDADKARLAEAGVEIGTRLHLNSENRTIEVSGIVAGGHISFIAVTEHGEHTRTTGTMPVSDALKWQIQKSQSRVESFRPSPAQKPWANVAYREQMYKSLVTSVLSCIALDHPGPDVKIVTKPLRRVLSEQTYEEGELVMLFDTPKLSFIEAGKAPAINAKALNIELSIKLPTDKSLWMLSPALTSDIVVPAWSVAVATEATMVNANMTIKVIEIDHRIEGLLCRAPCIDHVVKIRMPVMHNTTKVSPGDELIVNRFSIIDIEPTPKTPPPQKGKGAGKKGKATEGKGKEVKGKVAKAKAKAKEQPEKAMDVE